MSCVQTTRIKYQRFLDWCGGQLAVSCTFLSNLRKSDLHTMHAANSGNA